MCHDCVLSPDHRRWLFDNSLSGILPPEWGNLDSLTSLYVCVFALCMVSVYCVYASLYMCVCVDASLCVCECACVRTSMCVSVCQECMRVCVCVCVYGVRLACSVMEAGMS